MKRLYRAATLPDAHLLRGLLLQVGIPARVFNENAQGALGEIPFAHAYPEVWVEDERDWQRAREVISTFEHSQVCDDERRCLGCQEDNPGNFQVCWRCGENL